MDSIEKIGEELKKRLNRPDDVFLPLIVKRLVQTEEEANVILELPLPSEDIAKKLNIPKEKVDEIIQEKFEMGLIFPTKHGWQLGHSLVQFRESTCAMNPKFEEKIGKEFFILQKAWSDSEIYPDYVRKFMAQKIKSNRCVPDWLAIKDNPDRIPAESLPDILERASKLEGMGNIAAVWCCCRRWNNKGNEQVCIQMGRAADYAIKRGNGKKLTVDQALEICLEQEKKGSAHLSVGNLKTIPVGIFWMVCNCAKGSCGDIVSADQANVPYTTITSPSRYRAFVDIEKCSACQTCVTRCNFKAVSLKQYSGMKKWKSYTDPEACMGCGSCTLTCPTGARTLKIVRGPEHIPDDETVSDFNYSIPNLHSGGKD